MGRTRQECYILVASVTLICTAAISLLPAEEPKSVSMRFQWPSPLELHVERTFERRSIDPVRGETPPVTSTSRYVLRGVQTEIGYKIAFSDFEVVRAEPKPSSSNPVIQLDYVSRSVEPLLPTIVVDDAGQPKGFEGMAALRARIADQCNAVPGLRDDPQANRIVELLVTEQVLTQRALEDWNHMVQIWHDVDAVIGETKEIDDVPVGTAEFPIKSVIRYSIDRFLPCEESEGEASCIRLTAKQIPNSKDVRAASRALLGFDFTAIPGAPPTAKLEFEKTFTIDTHPKTLVPVRYSKVKRWSVSWKEDSGESKVFGRTDRWNYRFTPVRNTAPALPKKVAPSIKGRWSIAEHHFNGERLTTQGEVELGTDFAILSFAGQQAYRAELRVDPKKTPPEIDLKYLTGPAAGSSRQGIYAVRDGSLTLSFHAQKRPDKIESKKGTDVIMYVLKKDD